MSTRDDATSNVRHKLQALLEETRTRMVRRSRPQRHHLADDASKSKLDTKKEEILRLLECLFDWCEEDGASPGDFRISDPDGLAVALLVAGVVRQRNASFTPLLLSGREIGSMAIDGGKLLAELLRSEDTFDVGELVDHVYWTKLEFDIICDMATADASRTLVPRWRDELRTIEWTVEDLETALQAGAIEALTLRPVAELLRNQLVGLAPARTLQRVADALKAASTRSPEPTAEQLEWVREREPVLHQAIQLFGVDDEGRQPGRWTDGDDPHEGDWSDSKLIDALTEWVQPDELRGTVKRVRDWKLNASGKQAPKRHSRIVAHLIGQHFGLSRNFGYKVLSKLRQPGKP